MRILGTVMVAGALLAGPVAAVESPAEVPVVVSFSPAFEAELRGTYGADQGAVLRGLIAQSLAAALGAPAADPMKRISVEVVLERAKPTHPTPLQLGREPGIDFLRSISLGGAELSATLRAADGHALGTVSYSYYAPTLRLASSAGEAWADARRSIQSFAAAVAAKVKAVG